MQFPTYTQNYCEREQTYKINHFKIILWECSTYKVSKTIQNLTFRNQKCRESWIIESMLHKFTKKITNTQPFE